MARSFRIVRGGPEAALVEGLLAAQGFAFEPEPFHPSCRRLVAEPFPLGASLAATFGLIYIQDRSSMLPPLALAPPPGARVLDMCASPGGKTSFLAQLAGRAGYVLGNEPGADRLATLRQNLARMNLPQAVTTGMKGQDLPLPEASLGHILLDPPCSGWGTAEKNPKVLELWREGKVEPLVALQRQLLAKAASLLAPGGRLLYSTCTTNRAENEEQAAWAASELGLRVEPLAPFQGFSFHAPELAAAAGTLRVDQEGSQAQGFYLALLVKPGRAAPDEPDGPAGPEGQDGPRESHGPDERARADTRQGVSSPASGATSPRGGDLRDISGHPGGKARGRKSPPSGRGAAGSVPEGLPPSALEDPGLDWSGLPPGRFETFKDELCFVPARGEGVLPARRKGQRVGAVRAGVFRPWARASFLAPPPGSGPELDADEPEVLCALLEGRSLEAVSKTGRMALYFRGLPLGFLTVKGSRALWSDR